MQISSSSKQPARPAWMLQQLVYEHSILLSMAINTATHLFYTSTLNTYLTFCKLHDFDIGPTPETLSLYVTYQSMFINPKSIDSYLSGFINQMEFFSPRFEKIITAPSYLAHSKGLKGDTESPSAARIPHPWKTLKSSVMISNCPLTMMICYSSLNFL